MDEELKKALEFSNLSVTLNNQKRLIKEKYQEELVLYYNGGRFTVDMKLVAFIDTLINRDIESTAIIDDNGNPIQIVNLSEFIDNLLQQYTEASNSYLKSYIELSKKRNVGDLVEV